MKAKCMWNVFKICESQMWKRNANVYETESEKNTKIKCALKTLWSVKWSYIPDQSYRILIIGSSGSGKTNALLNLIEKQPGIDKIYLYAKDPYEEKYQYLINIREKVGLKHFNDPKALIECSNDMQDAYKDIDEYNINKERKILIVFDDMIADMINNKKVNSIVTRIVY